jgi:hypothetical protein
MHGQLIRYEAARTALADMGPTQDESSRYQQLAAMPAEHFETAVATANAMAGDDWLSFRGDPRSWEGSGKARHAD